jgi:Domain of unknown function (DUF1906)
MRLLIVTCLVFALSMGSRAQTSPAAESSKADASYFGFDLNLYPGDAALKTLRKNFSFVGYWLSPPPGTKQNTWIGKREILKSHGFGFAVLYAGPLEKELKSEADGRRKAANAARDAAALAKREQFTPHTIIFLDIEEGGRLSASYHAYAQSWIDGLASEGFRAGVYCSGIRVSEGKGVTILTANDIRDHIGARELAFWIFNDACPPAPGCAVAGEAPDVSRGGVAYAAIWQFARSPRVKEITARCAATYARDANCYAPGDSHHAWLLDLDAATSADPSGGRN